MPATGSTEREGIEAMNLSFTDNPYKTLGVERDATEAQIKQAYFALSRQHSP